MPTRDAHQAPRVRFWMPENQFDCERPDCPGCGETFTKVKAWVTRRVVDMGDPSHGGLVVGEVGEVVTKHPHSGACFTAMSALKLPTVHDMIHPSGLLPTTVIPLAKLGCTTAQAGHHDLPEILEILVAHDFGCPNWSRVAPKWSPQGLGRGGMTSLNTIVAFNSTHGGGSCPTDPF